MTTPKRNSHSKSQGRSGPPPVTAHRLFLAMVALWVAALFGLGSFAVPPTMLESLVTTIGLPAIVPAAAPPLGFTARVLVALILTMLGGALGVLAGRSLRTRETPQTRRRFGSAVTGEAANDTPKVRARDAHPDAPPRKPLTLSEDMVASAEDAAPVSRRRALAVTDESLPFDPVDGGPLPGHAPSLALDDYAVDLRRVGLEQSDEPEPAAPFENATPTAGFEQEPLMDEQGVATFSPIVAAVMSASDDTPFFLNSCDDGDAVSMLAGTPSFAAPLAAAGYRQVDPPATSAPLVRSPVASAPLDSLGLVQLIERLAVAMAERRRKLDALFATDIVDAAQSAGDDDQGDAVSDSFASTQAIPHTQEGQPTMPRMGNVGDAVRSTMQFAEPERVVSLRPFDLGAVGQAATHYVASGVVHDASWSEDNWDDGASAMPRFLSASTVQAMTSHADPAEMRATAQPHGDFSGAESRGAEADGASEELYPSLLDISYQPLRQDFIRIDHEEPESSMIDPVEMFPGQGPRAGHAFDRPSAVVGVLAASARSPASAVPTASAAPATLPDSTEADRALRAALATLQRMTAKG